MCGLFGFITRNGNGPDIALLQSIAAETETRGRHAFGLAWLDAKGDLHTFKRVGAATDDLDDLHEPEDSPQPPKGRELVIVDLGHVTIMPPWPGHRALPWPAWPDSLAARSGGGCVQLARSLRWR